MRHSPFYRVQFDKQPFIRFKNHIYKYLIATRVSNYTWRETRQKQNKQNDGLNRVRAILL